jgi:hypothetical protein
MALCLPLAQLLQKSPQCADLAAPLFAASPLNRDPMQQQAQAQTEQQQTPRPPPPVWVDLPSGSSGLVIRSGVPLSPLSAHKGAAADGTGAGAGGGVGKVRGGGEGGERQRLSAAESAACASDLAAVLRLPPLPSARYKASVASSHVFW